MLAGPDADGNCVDIVRVREHGSTLFEFCGTAAGARVVSNSNVLTLDFIASKRIYNARGFLLQYQGKEIGFELGKCGRKVSRTGVQNG